jgi:predicted nucleic acid-binding Zn ribbon protein
MKLEIPNCRECGLTFGVDEKAIEDDELVTCPKCDGRTNVQVVDEAGTPAWIERGYPSETGEE